MVRKVDPEAGQELFHCHIQPDELMQVHIDNDEDVAFRLYTGPSDIHTVYVKIHELPRLIGQLSKIALTHLIAPDQE